ARPTSRCATSSARRSANRTRGRRPATWTAWPTRGRRSGPSRSGSSGRAVGRVAALLFFAGPGLLVALAVSLRTARTVESYGAVMARVLAFKDAVRAASESEGVEIPLICAVASAESGGRPEARSGAGALGLMQLLPATGREMAASLGE